MRDQMVPATRVQSRSTMIASKQSASVTRESRPCENRPCASDGNVVLNMLHKQNHAQDEWARLALHMGLAWSRCPPARASESP